MLIPNIRAIYEAVFAYLKEFWPNYDSSSRILHHLYEVKYNLRLFVRMCKKLELGSK